MRRRPSEEPVKSVDDELEEEEKEDGRERDAGKGVSASIECGWLAEI